MPSRIPGDYQELADFESDPRCLRENAAAEYPCKRKIEALIASPYEGLAA